MVSIATIHTRPTILFVPGVFQRPVLIEPFQRELFHVHGYLSDVCALPSIDCSNPEAVKIQDDVEAIQKKFDKYIGGEGRDVVVVLHGYGGVPGAVAMQGFEKKKRMREGKEGGIIHVLCLAAWLVGADESLEKVLGYEKPPWAHISQNYFWPTEASEYYFYTDMYGREAFPFACRLIKQSVMVFKEEASRNHWHDLDSGLPVTYLICQLDRVVRPTVQMAMMMKVAQRHWGWIQFRSGHCPFVGQWKYLVDIVIEAVRTGKIFAGLAE